MKLFKSSEEHFLAEVEERIGPWLRSVGFALEPPVPTDFSAMYCKVIYRNASVRLRLSVDRGSEIVAEVAPAEPTSGWFDTEWHLLSGVIVRLQGRAASGGELAASPEIAEIGEHLEGITQFCSPLGARERERFVEHMTWPPYSSERSR